MTARNLVRLAALLLTAPAWAAGKGGDGMDATLRATAGGDTQLSRWRGKPVILFYEDRHSAELNRPLKFQLFERGKARGVLDGATVIAVANLEAFNFFPARQIALSYVRDEEKRVGVPVLSDLEGVMGKAPWNLPGKTSSVLLLDAGGVVVYRYSGRMKPEDIEAFFGKLGSLVGVDLSAL